MHHSSSSTHSSSQPGGISPGHTSLPESNKYSKAEYTNTQQDLPVQGSLHLDMQGFWLVDLFCQKAAKGESLLSNFSSGSSY